MRVTMGQSRSLQVLTLYRSRALVALQNFRQIFTGRFVMYSVSLTCSFSHNIIHIKYLKFQLKPLNTQKSPKYFFYSVSKLFSINSDFEFIIENHFITLYTI